MLSTSGARDFSFDNSSKIEVEDGESEGEDSELFMDNYKEVYKYSNTMKLWEIDYPKPQVERPEETVVNVANISVAQPSDKGDEVIITHNEIVRDNVVVTETIVTVQTEIQIEDDKPAEEVNNVQ